MSSIDFQNGFICGMATKGLTKNEVVRKTIAFTVSGTAVSGEGESKTLTRDKSATAYSVSVS